MRLSVIVRMRVIPCIDGTFRPNCGLGSCIDGSPGNSLVSIAIIYLFLSSILVREDRSEEKEGFGTNVVV